MTRVINLFLAIFWSGVFEVITMSMFGKIRRMYFRDGLSIREIARRTSLSRNTIKRWLTAEGDVEPKYRRPAAFKKLTPYEAPLRQWLEKSRVTLYRSLVFMSKSTRDRLTKRVESRCDAVMLGSAYLFAASFVWRCLTSLTMTPFSHPAHRTGHALLTHPALGQNIMPSPTEGFAEALADG